MSATSRASWARVATALSAATLLGACASASGSSKGQADTAAPSLGTDTTATIGAPAETTTIAAPLDTAPLDSGPPPAASVTATTATAASEPDSPVSASDLASDGTESSVEPPTLNEAAQGSSELEPGAAPNGFEPEIVTTTTPDGSAPSTTTPPLPHGVTEVSDRTATPYRAIGTESGPETKRIQERLLELGFWLQAVDGDYGHSTKQAVIAFQKFAGIERTGEVNGQTARALTQARYRAVATATDNTLVEVDKTRQLLFLVVDGRTSWVFNTSTGSGKAYEAANNKIPGKVERGDSITESGLFEVKRQHEKGWWEGDLGKIYRPKYFNGGIAIHGMNSIPAYPASHGCVRLSIPAMDFIWDNDLVPIGTVVWVHGEDPVRVPLPED